MMRGKRRSTCRLQISVIKIWYDFNRITVVLFHYFITVWYTEQIHFNNPRFYVYQDVYAVQKMVRTYKSLIVKSDITKYFWSLDTRQSTWCLILQNFSRKQSESRRFLEIWGGASLGSHRSGMVVVAEAIENMTSNRMSCFKLLLLLPPCRYDENLETPFPIFRERSNPKKLTQGIGE